MSKERLLGIDLGTTGLKACLFTLDGNLTGEAYRTSTYLPLQDGHREQHAIEWWTNLCAATMEVIEKTGIDPHTIAGVGICGFHHCPVLLDEEGTPIRPVLLLHDQRLVHAREKLDREGVIDRIEKRTMSMISAGHFPPIASYLRESDPDLWSRFRWIVLPKDYLRFRLTGGIATELCDATGLNLVVPGGTSWDSELCELLDLPPERLPTIHESHELAGAVSVSGASESGLVAGTPVAFGGGDSHCALLGLGCGKNGEVGMLLGTNSTLRVVFDRPLSHPDIKVWTQRHVVPDRFTISASSMAGASVVTWACEQVVGENVANAEEMALRSPPGSRGVTFLPYIYGERSPFYDPDAAGAFLGLRHWHTREDLIRSVFEGVAMNIANCYDLAADCASSDDSGGGGETRLGSVHLGGGGSHITMWHQLIADTIGVPIHVMSVRESGSLGAAMVAGVATERYTDFADAVSRCVREELTIYPKDENVASYRGSRAKMNELYRRLA